MRVEDYLIRPLTTNDLQVFFKLIDQNRQRLEAFFASTVAGTRTLADAEIYLGEIEGRMFQTQRRDGWLKAAGLLLKAHYAGITKQAKVSRWICFTTV